MDPSIAKLLVQLGTYGPLGVMCVLLYVLYWQRGKELEKERARNAELQKRVYELGIESLKADMEHTKVYGPIERIMDAAVKALAADRLRSDK